MGKEKFCGGITRAEIEKALLETAWAYYLKHDKVQYDSQELNVVGGSESNGTMPLRKHWGGFWRTSKVFAPEDATSDVTLFTVCSDFAWKVYRSTLGYPILGHALNALTKGLWAYTEQPEDMVVARWVDGDDKTCAEVCDYPANTVTEKHRMHLDEMRAFLANWKENLRPADILITYTHTMMYIGGGYVLDSWGRKYDMTTGKDRFERNGSVYTLHRLEDIYLTGEDPVTGREYQLGVGPEIKFFGVIRPLNVLTKDAGTGDPGDDMLDENYVLPERELLYPEGLCTSGYTITPATYSRLRYPGLGIDRTVNITPYGTAEQDGTVTYFVKLSNQSDDPVYDTYRSTVSGEPYYGQDHTGIVVTEKIPVGTVLEHASGKADVQGDTITWTVNLPAGGTLNLHYTVRVTAEVGSIIVSEGGYVADIPSNCIKNRVGGRKLAKPALSGLRQFFAAGVKKWTEQYGIDPANGGASFVRDIYSKAAGLALELPAAQELLDNLFVQTRVQKKSGLFTFFGQPCDTWMYTARKYVDPMYQAYQKMMVRGYLGGVYVYTERKNPRINEFSIRYMEPGDIVVGIKLSANAENGAYRTVESSKTIVYLGEDRCALLNHAGEMVLHDTEDILWESFTDDAFFCLRPTQAYSDINIQIKD